MTTTGRTAATDDYRDKPAYPVAEAARYLKLSPATLRSWVAGRDYLTSQGQRRWPALINPASEAPALLSFWNLIEAHVLRGLRNEHKVSIKSVRDALEYAERELEIGRLLLRKELSTTAKHLFLDRYGELIDLSASGQIAMRQIFDAHLKRVEWDEWQFPVRLYPFIASEERGSTNFIAIDPGIAFGRPIVLERGITTGVLADRIDAGENLAAVAADYDLTVEEVEKAILYERAA